MIVSCARALLWLLLPTDTRAIIVRDLDDEYVRFISPSRTRVRATGWSCRQVVGSIVPALRMRMRLTSASTTVPSKKPGFWRVKNSTGIVNTKSRKSPSSIHS